MNNDTDGRNTDVSLLLTDASDLMGKKSVRTTFKLSAEFIEAISILSSQLGIKQKSLFDHLMEDKESLRVIASRMDSGMKRRKSRVQKTFVISKKSLLSLDSVSKKFSASRDDIVEYSIQRLLPILAAEQQKQKTRETVLAKISEHFNLATELMGDIETSLGKDDPIYSLFAAVFKTFEDTYSDMEKFVDQGKRITAFPMEKLR